MPPIWLELIERAKKSGATELDLGNCTLTEMPDELFEDKAFCESIQVLSFGSHLMRHEDRQQLSLNSHYPNSISSVDPRISYFKNLTELSFYKNELHEIKNLESLVNLKILDLGSNKIERITGIDMLTKLEVLRISSNIIKKIEGLSTLTALQYLYLGFNRLEKFEGLENLVNLESLYIGYNRIRKIENLENLKKLKLLFADGNQIEDCRGLEKLFELKDINLDANHISDIYPLLGHIKRGLRVGNREYQGNIRLLKNPLKEPPAETVFRGNDHIINYFESREADDTVTVSETKVLILGAGGVGKTTLAKKLQDPACPLPSEKETTVGINISINYIPLKVDDREYKLHIWDFGGQDVYNATHQFFLTKRSMYILMEEGRAPKNVLTYWLQAQELFAEDSPVLLLQNLKAGSRKEIDTLTLKANFKNLRDYHEADISDQAQINNVVKKIKAQLLLMSHLGDTLPKKWNDIREDIESLAAKQDHMSLGTFREICSKYHIDETNKQDKLLLFLHDLGIVLHFKDIPELKRLVVIRPQWATDAVYKILDHTKQQDTKGHFNWEDLEKVWNVPQYDNMFSHLLAMMKKFELCYELQDKPETFIAPLLLSESRPEFEWDNNNNLQLYFQYDFMPEGIIPRLIVRLHSQIADQNKVWKRGAVFAWDNTEALVKDDYLLRRIEIRVKGNNPRGLLGIIAKEIDDINSKFYFSEQRNVRKMVPCICSKCGKSETPSFYKYETLQRWLNDLKRVEIPCEESGDPVNIQQLLNNVFLSQVVKEFDKAGIKNKKILLLLANPDGTEALNMNAEFDIIKNEHKLTNPSNIIFEFIDKLNAKLSDFTGAFAENPAIVHFSGHGEGPDGIIINDEEGTPHFFRNDQLFDLFDTYREVIECAVFSACTSIVQAELLSRTGIYVVGTTEKIDNQVTTRFSRGFYQAVFGGQSYESAFVSGKILAEGYNSGQAEKFVLYQNGRRIK